MLRNRLFGWGFALALLGRGVGEVRFLPCYRRGGLPWPRWGEAWGFALATLGRGVRVCPGHPGRRTLRVPRLSTWTFFDNLTYMEIHFYEVTNGPHNWGKLAVGTFERSEWEYISQVAGEPLLARLGHGPSTRLFLDLTTEGALFDCSYVLSPQLARHKIWVCPMFEVGLREFSNHDIHQAQKEWRPHVDVRNALFQFEGFRRSALIRQLVDRARVDARLSPSHDDKLWNAIEWAIGDEQPIYRRLGEKADEAVARVLRERQATFRRLFGMG